MQPRQDVNIFRGEDIGPRADELAGLDQPPFQTEGGTINEFGAPPVVSGVALGPAAGREKTADALNELIATIDADDHVRDKEEAAEAHPAGRGMFAVVISVGSLLHAPSLRRIALSCSSRRHRCTLAGKPQALHLG